jgi:hypothetical protein
VLQSLTDLWRLNSQLRTSMDQISIMSPNPKCRLYLCLIEFIDFIDWRYSQSCWYFRPLLWTSTSLTFSLVHLPPHSPFPVWISTGYVLIQFVTGGEGIEGLRQINTCRQVPLLVNFKKSRHLMFGVFMDFWSMHKTDNILILEGPEISSGRILLWSAENP